MPKTPLWSRATAFAMAFGLLPLPIASANRIPKDPNLDLVRLSDRVYAAIRREPLSLAVNANSVIILRDSDVVVVDAQFTRSGLPTSTRSSHYIRGYWCRGTGP